MTDNIIMYTNEDLKYLHNKLQDKLDTVNTKYLPLEEAYNKHVEMLQQEEIDTYNREIKPLIQPTIDKLKTKVVQKKFLWWKWESTKTNDCISPTQVYLSIIDKVVMMKLKLIICGDYIRPEKGNWITIGRFGLEESATGWFDFIYVYILLHGQQHNLLSKCIEKLTRLEQLVSSYIAENKTVGLESEFVKDIDNLCKQVDNFDVSIYDIKDN